jgi:hypothetical protein
MNFKKSLKMKKKSITGKRKRRISIEGVSFSKERKILGKKTRIS